MFSRFEFRDKEIYKHLFRVVIPATFGYLGLTLFDVVDIFWIEKLGAEAVAGVASAGFIMWALNSVIQVTASGATSLVGRFHGAEERSNAWRVIIQSAWLSLFISSLLALFLAPHVAAPFRWMGLSGESAQAAVDYFLTLLLFSPVVFIDMLAGSIFNGYGDNKISNIIVIFCLILNAVADPIFMFGWCGFKAMGVKGAAYATVLGHLVSCILRIYFLRKRSYIPPFRYFLNFKFNYASSIVKIGTPNFLSSLIWSTVYPFLTRLITPFGMIPLSAVGIAHRLENFPYFIAMGFGVGMTALVSYYKGKGETDKIERVYGAGMRVSTLLILPYVLLFLFFPYQVAGLMTSDLNLIDATAGYLFVIGVFELFMSWENVTSGVFTGLGLTYPTLLINLPLTIGRIPLGWFLAYKKNMGVTGIWWAISFTTFLKGMGLYVLYRIYKRKTDNFTKQ